MKIKKIAKGFLILFGFLVILGLMDFNRVTRNFEKPIFCIPTDTADDGGSGLYLGIGYSFYIDGNFMPDDEFPGVTRYEAKIFGITVKTGTRD